MKKIERAMTKLENASGDICLAKTISFRDFLVLVRKQPERLIRNVFQLFHDMVMAHVDKDLDQLSDEMDLFHEPSHDCRRLLAENTDRPFFADRLFSARFVSHVKALRWGAQQNKIYIFDGPPGCGKSTFLNNLLKKYEEYANTEEGLRYEVVWRIDPKLLGQPRGDGMRPLLVRLIKMMEQENETLPPDARFSREGHKPVEMLHEDSGIVSFSGDTLDIPCPNHDHPLLMIPKAHRAEFFAELFINGEYKWRLSSGKEYDWLFQSEPCTICKSLFDAFMEKLGNSVRVLDMIHVRPYRVNRRLGEGVTVFNPGDPPIRRDTLTNPLLEKRINTIFDGGHQVRYLYSPLSRTNDGIYALMDIKSHNTERLIMLHNIISDGIHKVEHIEEHIQSLFLAVMNPEDKKNIAGMQSFTDRIEYIKIPYVLDIKTEVEIYRNIFDPHIDEAFMPRVLHNFARIIISSRLNPHSVALKEWIKDPGKYSLYCDIQLQLLKMEVYIGHLPEWLSEEDRKNFSPKLRRKVFLESQSEGQKGFSGRDAINLFNQFHSTYANEGRLINMTNLIDFFTKVRKDLSQQIPNGFLDALLKLYNFKVLQEVKESLYYYNQKRISRDIKNYLFALNYEIGVTETCPYTGEVVEITEAYLTGVEARILGNNPDAKKRQWFRMETQKEFTAHTLTREILMEGKEIDDTGLYQTLFDRYAYNLKEKVLDPLVKNANFRRAIKDYDTEEFKTYDRKIRKDVTFLIDNLCRLYRYTPRYAKEICMYVIDKNLAGGDK